MALSFLIFLSAGARPELNAAGCDTHGPLWYSYAMRGLGRQSVIALLLVLVLALPAWAHEERREEGTKVTVTIAFCGAIGGFFFFIAIRSGLLPPDANPPVPGAALLTRDPRGWRMGVPLPALAQTGNRPAEPVFKLLEVRF